MSFQAVDFDVDVAVLLVPGLTSVVVELPTTKYRSLPRGPR